MANTIGERLRAAPSPEFAQICGFAAVVSIGKTEDTVASLVLQCLTLEDVPGSWEVDAVCAAVKRRYGIALDRLQVEVSLHGLEKGQRLLTDRGGRKFVEHEERQAILDRVRAPEQLEEAVRKSWLVQ